MNATTSLRIKIIAAFVAIYIIWGSTYLAIRFAIETIPPLLMAGGRFLIAGTLLFLWARFRGGAALPTFSDVKKSSLVGALLLLGGNGMVVLAEQSVPSGLTALIIATEPLMIVTLEWMRRGGTRPVGKVAFGLLLGFAGVVFLIGPTNLSGSMNVDALGATMLMVASLSWAIGSLYASKAHIQTAPLMTASVQMLAGGALLFIAGAATGELGRLDISAITTTSMLSVLYLIAFGSLVGFTCYSWMLKVVKPSLASTYAYVNPVVAVFLGWLIAGELFTGQTIIAAIVILTGVVLILSDRKGNQQTQTTTRLVAEPDTVCEMEAVPISIEEKR
ncbi:MAG: hypothetical protein EPO24_11830 [Bacteroidetes bacterium]|nr:MAG: hypothetical protein EPO24_11830 [Bacteroidota bacterium]